MYSYMRVYVSTFNMLTRKSLCVWFYFEGFPVHLACLAVFFYPAEAEIVQQLSVPLPFASAVHKQLVDSGGSQKHHSHLGGKINRLAHKHVFL